MKPKRFELALEAPRPHVRLLAIRGEIDLFTTPELKRAISTALDGDVRDLIVDLTHTAFIDSSGLAALIMAMKRARRRGGTLVVVDGQNRVGRTFRLAGLDQILAIVASRKAALAECSPTPVGT